MLKQDEIEIEILGDGRIKILTPGISMPNHTNADKFIQDIARLGGGEVTRERRTDTHRPPHSMIKDSVKTHG